MVPAVLLMVALYTLGPKYLGSAGLFGNVAQSRNLLGTSSDMAYAAAEAIPSDVVLEALQTQTRHPGQEHLIASSASGSPAAPATSFQPPSPPSLLLTSPSPLPLPPATPLLSEVLPKPSEPQAAADIAPEGRRAKYGFYLHVYADPAAVIYQVRQVKKHFVTSPIYVMSDGGLDFSPLCQKEGCTFQLCPPANDRWHPWPFFKRLHDAAVSLNVEFVIMLEPDNTIEGPIKRHPKADAGGLYVESRSFGMGTYVERMARARVPGFKWTKKSMSSGLCGGSYFRTDAILDAFSDENMMKLDWNYLGDKGSKEIYSSDFAMQYALAARGWKIAPWEESAQMDKKKDDPLTGAKDSAFRHYCSCYPGGKPTYNLKIQNRDKHLFKESHFVMTSGPYSSAVCQMCYNHTRYVKLWGSDKCTNSVPFHYSEKLMKRYHPEFIKQPCNLPWLCEPGKVRQPSVDGAEPTAAPPDPKASYELLDDDDAKCPTGQKALPDAAHCKAAAIKLGLKLAYEEDLYQENDPLGCVYRVPDKDVFFNAAEEGRTNGNRRLICQVS